MFNVVFYRCRHCGNVMAALVDSGVVPTCCGEPMTLLQAGTTDGAREKHVPAVVREGDVLRIRVGSVDHPMLPEHHIQFVAVVGKNNLQVVRLQPGDAPEAGSVVPEGERVTVYEYCNLHGLWSAEA